MIDFRNELPADGPAIETLLDGAFGPDRLKKSSYSYRQGVERLWPLCQVAEIDGNLVGTIRYWPIAIGDHPQPALLLGPVAVAATYRSSGIAGQLIRRTLSQAAHDYRMALLVGDEPYYGRFGFGPARRWGITMSHENPDRVLVLPLSGQMPSGHVAPYRPVIVPAAVKPGLVGGFTLPSPPSAFVAA